jgi:cobalt/nickel transport system permease protein
MFRKKVTVGRICVVSILTVILGLQAGAFSVVLETLVSGIAELPFGVFAAFMQPIHLVIGAVEGIVTSAVLVFIYRAQPSLLDFTGISSGEKVRSSRKRVIVTLAAAALVIGGFLSLFASLNPDGLEWSVKGAETSALESGGSVHENAAVLQENSAFMPDYNFKNAEPSAAGTSAAGIIGGVLTAAAAAGAGVVIHFIRKKKTSSDE